MNEIRSYKDLIDWQKSMDLVDSVYDLTELFPNQEMYSLTSQMRRAAVSIPSNIADGRRNGSKKDFKRFLTIAIGSCLELETQIEITKRRAYSQSIDFDAIEHLSNEVKLMLAKMIRNLE